MYPAFFPPFFFSILHLIITSPQHLHLITSTQQHPPQFSLIGFLQSEFIEWFPPSYESEGKSFLNISIIFICERALGGSGRGVRRSWQGALLMPPASRPTEPLTRNSFNSSRQKFFFPSSWVTRNTFPLGRTYLVAFHRVGAKTLLFYPCGSSLLGG